MTSAERMARHAKRRMWERKGIVLTDADYAAICADVGARLDEAVPTPHSGRVFVRMRFRGAEMVAIWDLEFGCVVSFVPQIRFAALPVNAAA
jgi:hypothetical protein